MDPTDPAAPSRPDVGDRGLVDGITGIGALPVFTEPYSITERLVPWGFGGPGGLPETGRAEGPESRVWIEGSALRYDEDRDGRDGDGSREEIILGFDMIRRADLVYGLAMGWETARSESFDGGVETGFDGYFFGPYAAWLPDPDLVVDIWVGYARRGVDSDIAGLESGYDIDRLFVSANATGRHQYGDWEVRPKFEFFYASDESDDATYRPAADSGLPADYQFRVEGGTESLALTTFSVEVRRPWMLADGTRVEPFARIGLDAFLDRPNDGRILGGDLTLEDTSDVTGAALLGVTARLGNGALIDARIGSDAIGDDDFDVYGGEVSLIWPF